MQPVLKNKKKKQAQNPTRKYFKGFSVLHHCLVIRYKQLSDKHLR